MSDVIHKTNTDFSLLLTNTSDLLGKKSVRATFRLSAEFIKALSILSSQLGIKQKSLFDHLMEDIESLRAIAGQMEPEKQEKKSRIQKTFVISKKSLLCLDSVSKKFDASRDDIVEYSIKRLLPVLENEREKQSKREQALTRIIEHFNKAGELLEEVNTLLGKEDPLCTVLETVFASYRNACRDLETLVEKGRRIAELPMDKFQK